MPVFPSRKEQIRAAREGDPALSPERLSASGQS